jgi:PKD repeat protein
MKSNYLNTPKTGLKALMAGLFLFGALFAESQCNANFNFSVGPNGSVSFVSTSTGTISGTLYNWNFGGSSTGTGITPTHTYTTNGYKTICLTITNSVSAWCQSIKCDSVLITNAPSSGTCNANFNYSSGTNGVINFGSTSTGITGSTNYLWTFGWGAPNAYGNSAVRSYTANGYDWVCLHINDAITGCSSTKCDTVWITNVPTTSTCNANFNYTLSSNGLVYFASTFPTTFSNTNYSWNFGGSATGTGSSLTHTYTSNGTKTICLTITNTLTNCTNTKCDTVNITTVSNSVTPCLPSVSYSLSKDSTTALTWNAYPFYPSNITNATWSWGDGNTSVGLYPSHTYSAAGTYSTCVTVSVSCGTITATYCYVANIFRSSQSSNMIALRVKQSGATGIKNQTKEESYLSIYPNPNNGEFMVELKGAGNQLKENTMSVYNMMGQKVAEKLMLTGDKQTIDVSNLPNGTYLIKINSEVGSLHKKITIQK